MLLLVGLPLLGVSLAGQPVGRYLEFPPVTRYVEHAPFSWPWFLGLSAFTLLITGPFIFKVLATPLHPNPSPLTRHPSRFPWWGWLGLGLAALGWLLAWTRFDWMGQWQRHTFTLPWAGYILTVNALTAWRSGRCMLRDRPRFFLALFPLSAVFWWFFEYLNRFVQNWYYIGNGEISALDYVLYATPPFATVLPAVLGTTDLLRTFPRWNAPLTNLWPVRLGYGREIGWGLLVAFDAGLMGIGVFPDYLFPLLWLSPLFVITALQAMAGEDTVFATVAQGDWRPIWQPAFAALICGVFWELWNYGSLAHWEYAVPFVHRFLIFEMPLIGYAGYLPFGLECVVIARLLPERRRA